jgi:signal transduction histidine kinase
MVNLLTNVVKYTDEGNYIWLTVQREGDKAVLRLRDTGIGIAPELLPHILDLLYLGGRITGPFAGRIGIGY